MKSWFLIGAAALGLASTAASAETQLIDFNEMLVPGANQLVPTYSSNGYDFAPSEVDPQFYLFFGEEARPFGWLADPVGTSLIQNRLGYTSTVSRLDGQNFDLLSLNYADLFNEGWFSSFFSMTFNYADGSVVSRYYSSDSVPGYQLLRLERRNLRSFSFTTIGGGIQYDNFLLQTAEPTAAVPEPASWAMMILGVGAVGYGARRRRTRTAATA